MTKVKEPERHLEANNQALNNHYKYADNFIRTSKYTLLTFLPINLFEQFRRAANAYFLLQIIIMCIPEITALNPVSTAVPLVIVLAASAIKDAWDDFGRHRNDRIVNNKKSKVFINKSLTQEKWMKLEVGDVLRLESDEQVPADMILLSTSEENGLCYVETAELDGETNLKSRQPLPATAEMGDDEGQLAVFNGSITCETPNNRLDKFHGRLIWQDNIYPLDNENLLLRGCVLRNTSWVYGVIVFAGHDTKLMMNSGVSKFKRSGLDKLLNYLIIWIAVLLAVICALCSFGTTMWEYTTGKLFQQYLPWIKIYDNNTVWIGIMHWPSFVMVLNTLIPISLYISVEVIRIGQSLWISWDAQMYHEPANTPARARTTTLTEELGQIEYVFSDKTGTLTQNVMTFKKCSIRGKLYGSGAATTNQEDVLVSAIPEQEEGNVDFSDNPYADGKFKFCDQSLMDSIKHEDQDSSEMFRLIALCHTVMVEDNDGTLEYQAQSPDEAALVMAARNFGFVFKGRSPTTMTIKVLGVEEQYELLAILDFNNVRKRMSVIVRSKDNKIILYCKGADNIMFERLDRSCSELMIQTTKHLNMFAAEGLRTLVTAVKVIPENEFKEWWEKYREASLSLENREEKVDQAYEEIERNLILIGATAIEDKLQDGVPDAIATLAEADIKIWVLTGDKLETAVNIGYSCQLLTDDMVEVFTVEGDSVDAVRQVIHDFREKVHSHAGSAVNGENKENSIKDVKVDVLSLKDNHVSDISAVTEGKPNSGFGLVITGKTLAFALDKSLELEFLELACLCKAVICCRVTPLQKALVVELVKDNKKAVTLAIGDGANDVSMIKAAHIGIGISGQEGMQAVMASDYSFAQFRFLKRLLLVHGRWSYMRMCKFLNYFFYKNFAFTLVQLWYAFFCGFSAQTLYDPWFMSFYNVIFTSGPIVFIAIFDQDVSDSACLSHPKLYLPGQKNILFNKKVFALSLLYGTLTSLDLFFIAYGAFAGSVTTEGLDTASRQFFGTVVAACLVITVNIEAALVTQYWTWINHFFTWGSILVYFCFYLVFYSDFVFNLAPQQLYYGVQYHVYGNWVFYVTLLLVVAICIIPSASFQFVQVTVHPRLSDLIRRKEQGKPPSQSAGLKEFTPRLRRRKLSKRSSYAFAHQEGFGKIVMSPKSFFSRRKNKLTINK